MKNPRLTPRVQLFLLLTLLAVGLCAQQNYIEGYVVDLKGDTTQGYIYYKNWKFNPQKIRFKPQLDKEEEIFSPNEIKAFKVDNDHYYSAIVETEISSRVPSSVDHYHELNILVDTVFLLALVDGEKPLYQFEDIKHNDNYYIKHDGKIVLLVYKRYQLTLDHSENPGSTEFWAQQTGIKENRKYLGQLIVHLDSCPSMMNRIQTARYNRKDLTSLFEKYYDCIGVGYQKETNHSKNSVYIMAGLTISTLKFIGDHESKYKFTKATYKPSTDFTFGLGYNYTFPRNHGRIAVSAEAFYTSYSFKLEYTDYSSPDVYDIYNTTMGFSYLKGLFLLRYQYPIKDFKVYANIGISVAFGRVTNNITTKESFWYSSTRIDHEPGLKGIKEYEFGVLGGLGISYKKYSLESKFELSDGFSTHVAFAVRPMRTYLVLGYSF